MANRRVSARRTELDPNKSLWTIMYHTAGESRPYAPAYTGMPYQQGRQVLSELRAKYLNERFHLTVCKAEHLTIAQSRKVLKELFSASRPDLLPVVRKARSADVSLLAPLAFAEQRKAERKLALERTNENRTSRGLKPIPAMPVSAKAEPEVISRNGYVVVRLGGAR